MFYGMLLGGVNFNPVFDIPDLAGKVIFITGGTKGIGFHTALALARHSPSHIYISGRDKSAAETSINAIHRVAPSTKITFLPCDLSDLTAVVECVRNFTRLEKRLDILFLNAGVMGNGAATTTQGYEIQIGTNHVGHFVLTKLLLPILEQTTSLPGSDVRIISVASIGHMLAPWSGIVFPELKTDMSSWLTMRRYGQSKLANILFAKELAKRLHEKGSKILVAAIHPGFVSTELYYSLEKWAILGNVFKLLKFVRPIFICAEEGAKSQLWAATAPRSFDKPGAITEESYGKVISGEYYTPIGSPGEGNQMSRDEELALKLWNWSEKETKDYVLKDAGLSV